MEGDDDVIDDHSARGRRGRIRRSVGLAAGAVALLIVGAVGGVVWSERHGGVRARPAADSRDAQTPAASPDNRPMPGMPGMPAPSGQAAADKTDEAVEVSLTPEAVERAGIKIAEAKAESSVSGVTVPGTVMSNAYRDTKVNALVGGIVRQVMVELGAEVHRGTPLAVIFSSELADAQMKYLSMRAMLEADHQKLERTQKLVALGSASRQLEGASHVVSEITVMSPADGLVIARSVNPGQVINAGQELFVVTDLSTVWIIGDLYERDFSRVRVGSPVTITLPSMPDRSVTGRVAYIDPRVDPATRTAKVRVEVPNRGGDLRLGMFVTMSIRTGTTERITVVPRAAVQTIGDRSVVYVPAEGKEGKFVERAVKVGPPAGEFVPILNGLKPGDKVVTDGSFYLRAEAARTRSGG